MVMDNLTFITKLIEFAAWPIAAIVVTVCLRNELRVLIPLIKKLKAGPIEVELEQMKKEIAATKTIAVAAEEKVEVVVSSFDDGDASQKSKSLENRAHDDDEQTASLLSVTERQVLDAMCESNFVFRSVSGVAKATGLSKAAVQVTFGSLIAKALLEQTKNKEGQIRWYVTGLGRIVAAET